MKIGQLINGYTVIGVDGKDFSTKGSGLSVWTFVRKSGVTYFMKEFLSPTYPLPDSPGSAKLKAKKKSDCDKFEKEQKALILTIAKNVSTGANLVYTRDFFRYSTKYYKVTEKIDVSSINIKNIAGLQLEKKLLILKTVSHSLNILHKLNIVHGDLKPNNILIKKTEGSFYTSKLIDFDNSYFAGQPPVIRDEVVGDPVYYSPELENYILGRDSTPAADLSCRSDIFALGIIFCQYLTGGFPLGVSSDKYPSNAVNNGAVIKINNTTTALPVKLVELVNSMLLKEPKARPIIGHVFNVLKDIASSYKVSMDDLKEDLTSSLPATPDEKIVTIKRKLPELNIIKRDRLSISMGYRKIKSE